MVCFSDVPYESKGLISAYWSSCMVFYLDILFQILTRKSFLNFNLKTGSLLLVVSFSSLSYLSLTFCLMWFIFFGWDLLVFVWFMVISASFLLTLLAVSCHLCARAAHVTDFMGASPSFCYLDDGCWWLHIAFQASSCQYLKMGVSWWSFGFVGIGLFVCLFVSQDGSGWKGPGPSTLITSRVALDHIAQDCVLEYFHWGEEVLEVPCPRINAE